MTEKKSTALLPRGLHAHSPYDFVLTGLPIKREPHWKDRQACKHPKRTDFFWYTCSPAQNKERQKTGLVCCFCGAILTWHVVSDEERNDPTTIAHAAGLQLGTSRAYQLGDQRRREATARKDVRSVSKSPAKARGNRLTYHPSGPSTSAVEDPTADGTSSVGTVRESSISRLLREAEDGTAEKDERAWRVEACRILVDLMELMS